MKCLITRQIRTRQSVSYTHLDVYKRQVVDAAKKLIEQYPDIGCFVFECSDIPPFAHAVTKETGRPVFDFIGLAHMVDRAIIPKQYPEFMG